MVKEISVLMSVYENDNVFFFEQSVDSLLNQTHLPSEIIIVVDGPIGKDIDDLLAKLSNNKLFVIIRLHENKGLAIAMNIGVRKAKYNLIARMDSDDISHPERFAKQIDFLAKNLEVDIVGTWIDEFIGNVENIISTRKVPEEHSDIISYLKGRCPLNHPTVIFRKESVLQSGNYLECHLKEDLYLWLRLYKNNFIFANIPESLLFFRTSNDVFRRRGGIKYAKSELKMFNYRYQIGLINLLEYLYFNSVTIPIRLMPPILRSLIYKFLLR